MELTEALIKRRSIRKYKEQDIDKKDLEKIIEAGCVAPSAHNRQPWEIVIVKENKKKIVDCMVNYTEEHPEDESILRTAQTIDRANTLFLVYCTSHEQYKYDLLSMGAFIENMLLKATELGIGTVWIGNVCPMAKKIENALGIDSGEKELVSAVALGYPENEPRELERKKVVDITSYL